MLFRKPCAVRPGDKAGIVSPSWGGASQFPWILDLAEQNLRNYFGLSVKEYAHTRTDPAHLAAHPEERARGVMEAFEDSEVSVVISVIGGDDAMRLLPFLEPSVFRKNPKVLLGYSDTATLLTWVNQMGLVTFNGPSMLAGWSQMARFPRSFCEQARTVLFGGRYPFTYPIYPNFSEGYLDWSNRANLGKTKPLHANEGPHMVSGDKAFEGTLFGGCIETLECLKGTRFWPSKSFWKGKVLFLETSENVPPIHEVKAWIRNYALQGVFQRGTGLLFGRARGYTPLQKKELDQAIRDVIHSEFDLPNFPIVTNLDFGHTDPQWILPLGAKVRVNPVRGSVQLVEPPTTPG